MLAASGAGFSQSDSTAAPDSVRQVQVLGDSLNQDVETEVAEELFTETPRHSPTKAVIRSAVIPGWGQVYNDKYWKLPIVYGGLGGIGYWVYFNADNHRTYRQALEFRNDGDSTTIDDFPFFTESQLGSVKEYYRSQLDLSILLLVAFYGLQIVDAAVDAHLYEFDVGDDLSLRWSPWVRPDFRDPARMGGVGIGLRLTHQGK